MNLNIFQLLFEFERISKIDILKQLNIAMSGISEKIIALHSNEVGSLSEMVAEEERQGELLQMVISCYY